MITKFSLKTHGRNYAKQYYQTLNMASLIKLGKTVALWGCKEPDVVVKRLKDLVGVEASYEPMYNGQGKELGKMIKPDDDTPVGYTFKLAII